VERIDSSRGALAPGLTALARLSAIGAALALATSALGAPRTTATKQPATTAPTAAAKQPAATAPASTLAARPPVAPVAPVAPRRAAPLGADAAFFGGGIGALSAFKTGQAISLSLDYAIARTPPGWRKLDLEWHLVASFAHPTGETGLTGTVVPPFGVTPVQVDAGSEKVKALLFEVVPTARVLWSAKPGVAFFADAGLGLCQTFESYDRSEMFFGRTQHSEYVTGVVARLGLGLSADVTPRWRVVLEPVAFDLQLGPNFSAYTPTLGVAYRL